MAYPVKNKTIGTVYGRKCCRPLGNGKKSPHYWTLHTHKGIDFPVPAGTDVFACADGTVVGFAIWGTAFGKKSIIIKHVVNGETYYAVYAHLMKDIVVSKGATVKKGQLIGKSGGRKGHPEDGNVAGEHLHLEVRKDSRWAVTGHVDPAVLLAA